MQRQQLAKAASIDAQLAASSAAGRADVAAVLARARVRCGAAPFALAVARLTERHGVARLGGTYRMRWLYLRGQSSSGDPVYRLDWQRSSRALAIGTPSSRLSAWRRLAPLAVPVGRSLAWSGDPTRAAVLPERQALLARRLTAVASLDALRDARRSLLPLRRRARQQALAGGPLLASLASTVDVQVAARHTGDSASAAIAAALARHIHRRVRRADAGAWSRVDGHWSSLAGHRVLVRLARSSQRLHPNDATRRAVQHLAAQLRTPPVVSFRRVPLAPFYPVPLDGSFDSEAVEVSIDKPSGATVTVYDAAGQIVRRIAADVAPGTWTATWNGRTVAGAPVPAASYRYSVRARDLAGNHKLLAGLGTFVVARDTVPPTVYKVRVRYLQGADRRALRVRWYATEKISPHLRIQLVLRANGAVHRATLHNDRQQGTEMVWLRVPAGRWTTRVRISDGAGNAVGTPAGSVVLP